jgi:hypothetical protein
MAHVKNTFYADAFLAYIFQPVGIGYEKRGIKTANGKIQKEQEQSEAQPDGA